MVQVSRFSESTRLDSERPESKHPSASVQASTRPESKRPESKRPESKCRVVENPSTQAMRPESSFFSMHDKESYEVACFKVQKLISIKKRALL